MKIITNPFECGYADTEPNYRDDICRHPKAAGLLCPGELTFPKDCPLPDVPTIQSHQVEMPSEEEIMCYFNNHSQVIQALIPTMTRTDVLRLVEWLKSKIKSSDPQVKVERGAPFDEPIYNPACKDCGHQNSVNCNTCRILNPQFE